MKALSLHQPWASLIAVGAKTIETRSWSTSYRGPLLIHAGQQRPPMLDLPPLARRCCQDGTCDGHWHVVNTITAPEHQRPHITDPDHPMRDHVPQWATSPTLFWPHRGPHADVNETTGYSRTMVLPLGAIVASCELVDVVPMVPYCMTNMAAAPHLCFSGNALLLHRPESAPFPDGETEHDVSDQRPFGDFTPGRYAWLLEDVVPTTERCPQCWGSGGGPADADEKGQWSDFCQTCGGSGWDVEPVPARGRQRLWEWKP